MRRRFRFLPWIFLGCLLLAGMCWWPVAGAPIVQDLGDLTLGQPMQATLGYNYVHQYRLVLAEAGPLEVRYQTGTGVLPLEVRAGEKNGPVIGQVRNDLSEKVLYLPQVEAGTYYVVLTQDNQAAGMKRYTLTANNALTDTPLAPPYATPAGARSQVYRVTQAAPGSLYAVIHKQERVSTTAHLYRGAITGTPLFSETTLYDHLLALEHLEAGDYFLLLHTVNATTPSTPCTITLSPEIPSLALAQAGTGAITHPNEAYLYRLAAPGGTPLFISLCKEAAWGGYLEVRQGSATGTVVAATSREGDVAADQWLEVPETAAGAYYLRVEAANRMTPITAPLTYALTVQQSLPALSGAATTVTSPGAHSVRWFSVPSTAGAPLYAFADHNTEQSLRLTLVQGTLDGATAAAASGPKDCLAYLPSAGQGPYYLKVSESTAPSCQLTVGSALPALAADTPVQGTLANEADIHWYQVRVNAGEEVLLHLDKEKAYATSLPLLVPAPAEPPAPTGTSSGDVVEFLTPDAATTYFVRVMGKAGKYTLRAARQLTALPAETATPAVMAHAGDERWVETTVPAGQPLFLVAEKTTATNTPVEVYRASLKHRVATFSGTRSDYAYLPPQASAARYLIRKRAASGFAADSAETLLAASALPALRAGETKTGALASSYQRKFFGVEVSNALALQGNLPLTIQEPAAGKTLAIGTKAAVAGLGAPAVLVVEANAAANYTVAASSALAAAGTLYFSNAFLEAKIDLATTSLGRLKYYAGANVYLGGEGEGAQYLFMPEGAAATGGWTVTDMAGDSAGAQVSWYQAANQVRKTLLLRATSARATCTCQFESPKPLTLRSALIPATGTSGESRYAFPAATLIANSYTPGTTAALYPTTLGEMTRFNERWLAFWHTGTDEVYGYTFGREFYGAISTDGPYTVARMLCPAGNAAITLHIARPRPDPPYQALTAAMGAPSLTVAQAINTAEVPQGTPIAAEIVARNTGVGRANGVRLQAVLPARTTYVENSAAPAATYASATRTLTWEIGRLEPGASTTVGYAFTVEAEAALRTELPCVASVTSTEELTPVRGQCVVTVGGPRLTGVSPEAPGNAGIVTLRLSGSNLSRAATVTLTRDAVTLPATVGEVNDARTELTAAVDLAGQTGIWDLTLVNPGGATATLPGAVRVTEGGQGTFWSELSGPRELKLHAWETMAVQYGNQGNVDLAGRILLLYIPDAGYRTGTVRDDRGQVLAGAQLPNSLAGPILCWVPRVGAGEGQRLGVEISPQVTRGRAGTLYPEISLLHGALSREALGLLLRQATVEALQVPAAKRAACEQVVDAGVNAGLAGNARLAMLWGAAEAVVTRLRAHASLATYLPATDAAAIAAIQEKAAAVLKAGTGYPPLSQTRSYAPAVTAGGPVQRMAGPLGLSTLGYVLPTQRCTYTVNAQQPAEAGAAVKSARILTTLDTDFDWRTLTLEALSIGGIAVDVRGRALPLHGFVDLRPGVNAMAEYTLTLDTISGRLEWQVAGYHPVTWAATTLLLPNTATDAPKGEMSMCFSLSPKTTLQSGVQLSAAASITFDTNAAQTTNTVTNTVDAGTPQSAVQGLPIAQEAPEITVRWSGKDEDNGSGLLCYSVYVSDNGGPYTCWQSRTTNTSGVYTGVYGHTYRFYSVAEDLVGHSEAPPSAADATIKIGRDTVIGRGLRLIGVPVQPGVADPKQLLGFTGTKWARYLPGVGYVTYGNDPARATWFDPPASVPGRGYWGQWAQDTLVDPVGEVVPADAPFAVELAAGWNLLGNPWTKPIPWDPAAIRVRDGTVTKTLTQAAAAGWIADHGWLWMPEAATPTRGQYWMVAEAALAGAEHAIPAWHACWLKAERSCTLLWPPPLQTQAAGRASPRRLAAEGWQMRLSARGEESEDGFNWLGVGTPAQVARLRGVAAPPAPLAPGVELTFLGSGGRTIDLRAQGDALRWRFRVTGPRTGEQITLRWPDLSALPGDVGLQLVDEGTGACRYLRTCEAYTFTLPRSGEATFRIEPVARGALRLLFVQARASGGRGQGMTIEYRCTCPATVVAEVRTITGRLVRRLSGRAQEDGRGTLTWDGRMTGGHRAPGGIYLVQVIAAGDDGRRARGSTTCLAP